MKLSMKVKKSALFSILAVVLVVVVVAVSVGAATTAEEIPTEAPVETGIRVSLATPQRDTIAVITEYVGRAEPGRQVAVIPRTAGEVMNVYYDVGDTVNAGDLLFDIDPTDIQMQVDIAQAGLNLARASVEQALGSTMDSQVLQAESGYLNAKNAYNSAQSLLSKNESNYSRQLQDLKDARKDAGDAMDALEPNLRALKTELAQKQKEMEALVGTGDGSTPSLGLSNAADYLRLQAEIDALKSALSDAQAAYTAASTAYYELDASYDSLKAGRDLNLLQLRSSVTTAEQAVSTAEQSLGLINNSALPEGRAVAMANLAQAEAQVRSATRQLDHAQVTAPISGVIESRNVEPQNMVSSSGPSFIISNKDMITVSFRVPERALAGFAIGDTVTLEKNGTTCDAYISEIPTMIDSSSGLFAVKATVSNPPFQALTGSVVTVNAQTQRSANALIIPLNAIYYEDGVPHVYVYQDGVAVKTPLELGILTADSAEVLSGLSANTQIVSSWNSRLRDGALLEIAD
ncbi:efflux RND transporter periplasmic adaptor subunit [Ruminococcaceae bacterium OttesenSCG-928-L11]|nr:efflux RND transporter periplasmic adaptor subunit [Ruminococcaceae bacterium OttesenSCG-928-L11]